MRYVVTSSRIVGAKQGGTVERDETDPLTRALVKGGHLRRETVGGYSSSGKPATELKPPPKGPAPRTRSKKGDA